MADENDFVGQVLISSPQLTDSSFQQTLILPISVSGGKVMGVVLNRLTTMTIKEAWQESVGQECLSEELLYVGGPISGPIMALHTFEMWGDKKIAEGVYFSTEAPNLITLVNVVNEGSICFYIGYAGWEPGQLEREMLAGFWFQSICDRKYIFRDSPDDNIWKIALNEHGNRLMQRVCKIKSKHVPEDISSN